MRTILLRYRRLFTGVVIVAVVFGAFWYVFSERAGQTLQAFLTERCSQQVNGRVQVGMVDLSLLGQARIRDVELYTKQGALLAHVSVVKIKYSWSDLAKLNFGISNIKEIELNGAEFWLQEEKNRWNWEGLIKEEQAGDNKFQGKMQIKAAKVHCQTALLSKSIDEVNGIIDFYAYPNLDISLKGKMGQGNLAADGNWANGQFALIIVKAQDIDLLEFRDSVPAGQPISIEGGKLTTASVTIERDAAGIVKWQTEGGFSGVKLAGKANITDGQGRFSGNQDGFQLQNIKFAISGQQAEGQGSLFWSQGSARIDAAVSIPDADPTAFVSGLMVQRPVACQIKLTGLLAEPDISGSFSIPQATFSNMPVDRVVGNFKYGGNRVLLQGVSGSVYQGTIGVSGEVQVSNESYELEASGQGLDSSRLTDKDVQGPLDFNGHVSGKGDAAMTQGTFSIRDGKAYGIPFITMKGNFIKRGSATELSGITMQTMAGTIYPEQLSKEVLERTMPQGQLALNEENIKKEAVGKLLPRIFR